MVHEVPIFIPGKHQAKVGDGHRHPIERENIVVSNLLHQYYFFAISLPWPLDHRRILPLRSGARVTYAFRPLHAVVVSSHPKDFKRHLLVLVIPFPDFGRLREAKCTDSLLHDAFEFICCWNYAIVATKFPKFDSSFPL